MLTLVDELGASSADEFAGSPQAPGRATITGTQTQGNCLVMKVEPLAMAHICPGHPRLEGW